MQKLILVIIFSLSLFLFSCKDSSELNMNNVDWKTISAFGVNCQIPEILEEEYCDEITMQFYDGAIESFTCGINFFIHEDASLDEILEIFDSNISNYTDISKINYGEVKIAGKKTVKVDFTQLHGNEKYKHSAAFLQLEQDTLQIEFCCANPGDIDIFDEILKSVQVE